jgi:iron complex transport system substrate-binding protein
MKIRVIALISVLLLIFGGCVNQHPTVTASLPPTEPTSETAVTETIAAEPTPEAYRLIATSRATVEICSRLDLELVGVPALEGLPECYADAARTGSAMAPDVEAIKILNPTEVVGPDTLESDISPGYVNANIPATFLNLRAVGGLYDSVEYLGNKYGAEDAANALLTEYQTALAELEAKKEGKDAPRVLILMGMPGAYIECTQNSYVGDLIALCGGANVVTDPVEGFVSWNTEDLLELDPDIILRTAHALPDLVPYLIRNYAVPAFLYYSRALHFFK